MRTSPSPRWGLPLADGRIAGQPDVALALLPVPGPPVFDDETRAQLHAIVSKGAAGGLFFAPSTIAGRRSSSSKAWGVEFLQEPTEQPYGIDAGFRDPSGNQIRMAQCGIAGAGRICN